MKRFLFLALFSILAIIPSLASAQTNSVSLTTYYPAPFGAYDRLRLVPRDHLGGVTNACTAAEEGTLYIDQDNGYLINQCRSLVWSPLTGGEWSRRNGGRGLGRFFDNTPTPNISIDQYFTTKVYNNLADEQPYVGIGTTDPVMPLHVVINNGNDAETVLGLENSNTAANNGVAISFYGATTGANARPSKMLSQIIVNYEDHNNDTLITSLGFRLGNGTTRPTEVMHLDGRGFLGVNENTPDAILELGGNRTALLGNTRAYMKISSGPANVNDGDVLSILANGRVGINNTTPDSLVHISGNLHAVTLQLDSDSELKKDILPVKNALEKVARLNGVSFEWKNQATDTRTHMGVIAQDVEKVFPEIVYGENGKKSVDYPSLIAPLIEAVKELKDKNESLSQQLLDQSSRIKEQQQQIESLQKSLATPEPALAP